MCVQDDERPMLDVLDQASPVVLESFTHVLSDSVSNSWCVCGLSQPPAQKQPLCSHKVVSVLIFIQISLAFLSSLYGLIHKLIFVCVVFNVIFTYIKWFCMKRTENQSNSFLNSFIDALKEQIMCIKGLKCLE